MNKEEIIESIKNRIESEHRKHPDLDWARIAAGKIYSQWTENIIEERACPCLYLDEPCNKHCTCKNGFSSYGCNNCCTYGSEDQRKKKAVMLNNLRLK